MTPAPISVDRYTVTGDIAYPIHEDTNGEYVRHSDYAALLQQLAEREAEVYLLRSWLCDCFVNAGADTDGSTDVRALSERAVQAVIDLRRDYDENEDWKGRAEAAERAREELWRTDWPEMTPIAAHTGIWRSAMVIVSLADGTVTHDRAESYEGRRPLWFIHRDEVRAWQPYPAAYLAANDSRGQMGGRGESHG